VALLALVGVSAGVPVAAATAARSHTRAAVTALPDLDLQVVARINSVRAAHGLSRLRIARGLGAAARVHTGQMARSGLFRHESPDGTAFWKRVRTFYGRIGFSSWSVGETLVWESPSANATEVVTMWLNSPEHREILLTPDWREIGVSAVQDPAAPGDFEGLPATIVTADFGVRTR
jgi:uncharacterized protein YkwD